MLKSQNNNIFFIKFPIILKILIIFGLLILFLPSCASEKIISCRPVNASKGLVTAKYTPTCQEQVAELIKETKKPFEIFTLPTTEELYLANITADDLALSDSRYTDERMTSYKKILETDLYNINAAVIVTELALNCYQDSLNVLIRDNDSGLVPSNEMLYILYEIEKGASTALKLLNDYSTIVETNVDKIAILLTAESQAAINRAPDSALDMLKTISTNVNTGVIRANALLSQYENFLKLLHEKLETPCSPGLPTVIHNLRS
jgi:hypothetical protein